MASCCPRVCCHVQRWNMTVGHSCQLVPDLQPASLVKPSWFTNQVATLIDSNSERQDKRCRSDCRPLRTCARESCNGTVQWDYAAELCSRRGLVDPSGKLRACLFYGSFLPARGVDLPCEVELPGEGDCRTLHDGSTTVGVLAAPRPGAAACVWVSNCAVSEPLCAMDSFICCG